MYSPIHVFLLILAIILQVSIAPLFSVRNATPDFLLIVIIAITFQRGRVWGIVAAFFAGIIFDFLGTGIVGLSSFAKCLAAYIVGFFGSEKLERRFGAVSGLLIGVLLVHDSIYYFAVAIGTQISFWRVVFTHALPSTIYTFCFLIMVHLVRPKVLWGTPNLSTR